MNIDYTKSAFQLAIDIKNQKISSLKLTEYCIQKIKEWNPRLNAMVEDNFNQALQQARECDERVSQGNTDELPPLFGVPMTIKEMISVEGFRLTVGSIHRKDKRSTADATVVKRLKKAGIIILGTTNVPEMGLWFECNNPIYGDTLNPYNQKYTSGGSSGGEAALLGAGASPLGLGSDIGGSLRMPAAFCGIFAHKPSEKWVPLTGQFPYLPDEIIKRSGAYYPFTVIGPMSRTAVDLKPYLKILMGPDNTDPETKTQQLSEVETDWKGKKVYILPAPQMTGCYEADLETREAVHRAATTFQKRGAEIIELPKNIFKDAFQLWSARSMSVETKKFIDLLGQGNKINLGTEFLKWLVAMVQNKRPNYQFSSLLTALLEIIAGPQKKIIEKKLSDLKKLELFLQNLLGTESILLMPAHPRTAPMHNKTLLRPFDFAYTAILNALGVPATSVPIGFGQNNLPIGVQVVAAQNQDHLCIDAAIELEKDFGGWIPPKL